MTSEPAPLPLTAWRRPLWLPLILSYVLIALIGPPVLAGLLFGLGFRGSSAFVAALVVVATFIVTSIYFNHRKQPAGSLQFASESLRYDAWRGLAVDVPMSAVQRAVITRYPNKPELSVLTIWLDSRRIYIHERRLEGTTLENVLANLLGGMEQADRMRVQAASESTARWQGQTTRRAARVGLIAGVVGGGLVVLRILLPYFGSR